MAIASLSFDPVPAAHDALIAETADRRLRGLDHLTRLLGKRLDREAAGMLAEAAGLLRDLDRPAAAMVFDPCYGHWWARVCEALQAGNGGTLRALAPALSRFPLLPAAARGRLEDTDLRVPPDERGELRFPGHPRHLAAGLPAGEPVRCRTAGGVLRVTGRSASFAVELADLLDLTRPPRDPRVRERALVPGTSLEVDSSDPWIRAFLEEQNVVHPSPGRTREDMRPDEARGPDLARLAACLARIETAWPAMHQEIIEYAPLIVPFSSSVRTAFTHVSWPAAIFLLADFRDAAHTVERLVHETSHLRLNLLTECTPMHEHGWSDTVPSPFRAGPRPITGLCHGAFVFTRVATAFDRIARIAPDPAMTARIPVLLGQVERALTILLSEVRLTAAGRALVDDVGARVAGLARIHGAADVKDPDPYLEL
jgi:HEXXH motif-containing protein